jgi:signal peptide peptidase SppA
MSNIVAKKLSKLCGKLFYTDPDSAINTLNNLDVIVSNFVEGKTTYAFELDEGSDHEDVLTKEYYRVKNGVAAIPVFGTLLNRCYSSYGIVTGYQYIRAAFNTALADTDVKGILLDIDSPGGQSAGCFELVDYMATRRGEKPIKALVNTEACSAAYLIACVADEISSVLSGTVGSIGMAIIHKDMVEFNAKFGVKYTIIRAGAHKLTDNTFEALSDEKKQELQEEVDLGYKQFAERVTALRSIAMSTITDLDSRAVSAQKGLELGLIDKIEDEEDAIRSFIEFINKPVEEIAMDKEVKEVIVDTVDITNKAIASERSRIKSIMQSSEAEGRETLAAKIAFDTDMTADQAIDLMKSSPKTSAEPVVVKGADFNSLMDNGEHPEISAESGATEQTMVAAILQAQTLATGRTFN